MNEQDFKPESPAGETFPHGRAGAAADQTAKPRDPAEWPQLKQQVSELLEYLGYYLHAKADSLKLKGRKTLLRIELEFVALLVIAGAVVVAITLIFSGVAQGLTQLSGNQPWLGPLGAGLLLLGCAGGGGWWWYRARETKAYEETVEKYEHRKQQQQARFGHDVAERAQAARPDK